MQLLCPPFATKTKLMIPKGSASWEVKDIIRKDEYDNVLLLSFSMQDQETVDIRQCFDESTHIFAFGRNAQACVMEVGFLVFLYNGFDCTQYKWMELQDLRDRYEKNRVYKLQKPVKIRIDELAASGFLVRMAIGEINPAIKACVVSFTFILDQET